MPKCLPIWHFETVKTFQIKLTRKFWDVSAQTTACRRDGLFFALNLILSGKLDICGRDGPFLLFTKFWAENWTSADLVVFKEPVLLLRSENMVTLVLLLKNIPLSGVDPESFDGEGCNFELG